MTRTMRIYVFLCAIYLAGCSQTVRLRTQDSPPLQAMSSVPPVAPAVAIESELRTFAASWKDSPYIEGGTSISGVDAPGLVVAIGDQILGVSLPHSTARQLGFGEEVERNYLMPGDIIFFRPTSMPRHVGVYLSSQEFLHAWPDDGVSIGRLDDPYWNGAYWAGRRVLGYPTPVRDSITSDEETLSDSLGNRRVGW